MRAEILFPFFVTQNSLSGIGPKLAPVLEKLTGGKYLLDLILHLPERWIDRALKANINATEPDEIVTIEAEIQAHTPPKHRNMPHRVYMRDDSGFLTLIYFNARPQWLARNLPINERRIISGKIEDYNGERQMVHPDYICNPEKGEMPPRVEPIYPLSAGLTNKRLLDFIRVALEKIPPLPEWIDTHLLEREGWPTFHESLMQLHMPDSYDEAAFSLARNRLAYDEALARELVFAVARQSRQKRIAPSLVFKAQVQEQLIASLTYHPTKAQLDAGKDIAEDMAGGQPMRRILQGDVGSGKTLVSAFAAVQAIANTYQCAIMAPTEVLARQQADSYIKLLAPLGYQVQVLTGRDKGIKREDILETISNGQADLIVGTQALFQSGINFHQLGLVIVDEQHRFGVNDRLKLGQKGKDPHILVMSATPIPRTLVQSFNGDMDVSILDEKPPGRTAITTRAAPDTRLNEVFEAIKNAIDRGEQVYWVCPKVDADDEDSDAISRHAILSDLMPCAIELIHGRLRPVEKDAALERFRSGVARILVATTVIEVGVDVPNATIIVIERAEIFGLAQLHQLRGRVGRGVKASACLLLYRPPLSESGKIRLETLRKTENGFEIAEIDFKLRGPGDLLGLKQSGIPDFRILDISQHKDLFSIARKDAAHFLIQDPDIQQTERAYAMRLLKQLLSPLTRIAEA